MKNVKPAVTSGNTEQHKQESSKTNSLVKIPSKNSNEEKQNSNQEKPRFLGFNEIQLFPLPSWLYIVIPVFFGLLFWLIVSLGGFSRLSLQLNDVQLSIRPGAEADSRIVFISIDDFSLDKLGEWPWRRSQLARYLLEAESLGPGVMVLDMNFDLPSNRGVSPYIFRALLDRGMSIEEVLSESDDRYFGNILNAMESVVVASFFPGDESGVRFPHQEIQFDPKNTGFSNVLRDPDGIIRRFIPQIQDEINLPLVIFNRFIPELQIAIESNQVEIWSQESILGVIPRTQDGSILLDWPRSSFEESFLQIGFEIFPYLVQLEEDVWSNIRLLQEIGLLRTNSLGSQALGLHEQYQRLLTERILRGGEGSIQTLFRIRQAAEDLLFPFLTPDGEEEVGRILESVISQDPGVTRSDVRFLFQETQALLEELRQLRTQLSRVIQGSAVITAYTATGTTDIGSTPFFPTYVNAGIHGVILNMFLGATEGRSNFIRTVPLVVNGIMGTGFALITAWFLRKKLLIKGLLIVLVCFALIILFLLVLSLSSWFFDPLLLIAPQLLTGLSVLILHYLGAENDKKWLYQAFSHYISQEFIDQLVQNPEKLQLGGEEREITVLFTDIKDFSSLAQVLSPRDLVRFLNFYFSQMSDVILDWGGTIDKFEGDAIVAFFGAPLELLDHSSRALSATLAMNQASQTIDQFLFHEFGLDRQVETRIGINTGIALVGNLGTDRRMDYTAMGLEVNTAARLETANKALGTRILLSQNTKKKSSEEFLYRYVGNLKLQGIDSPISSYEVRGKKVDLSQAVIESTEYASEVVRCLELDQLSSARKNLEAALVREPNDPYLLNLSNVFKKGLFPREVRVK